VTDPNAPHTHGWRIVLIGPPGVGKGTQATLLAERLGLRWLSSGVIFRNEIEASTDLGRLAKRYIDHGQLVPNGVTIEMMAKRIESPDVRRSGFILDGFPRTVGQATALDEILTEEETFLDTVVSIDVPIDLLVHRLSGRIGCTRCGAIYHQLNKPPKRDWICDVCNSPLFTRSDDTEEAIQERLMAFYRDTKPVIDYFDIQGKVHHIDGQHDPEDVYTEILDGMKGIER